VIAFLETMAGQGINDFQGERTPLLSRGGWLRDQEEVAKPPYRADGVVLARIS